MELVVVIVIDVPGSYHNGVGGLSIADGHAEVDRWLDPRVTERVTGVFMASSV
jgi:hypothetical protein